MLWSVKRGSVRAHDSRLQLRARPSKRSSSARVRFWGRAAHGNPAALWSVVERVPAPPSLSGRRASLSDRTRASARIPFGAPRSALGRASEVMIPGRTTVTGQNHKILM